MSDEDLLTEVELFADLTSDEMATITDAMAVRALQRGDVLFSEGDEPTELFVVTSGRIAISNQSVDGRESMMALMERGDLFGEMPLFDQMDRSAGARALEASEVIAIPYEPVQSLYRSRPELLWRVVALLAMRLRTTDAALADSVDNLKRGLSIPSQSEDDFKPLPDPLTLDLLGITLVPDVLPKTPPFIDQVRRGSPAEKAGLKTDDLILFCDDDIMSSCDVFRLQLLQIDRDETIRLTVQRGQELIEATLSSND